MADDKGVYGTRHVMEEEMRAAGQGVFEAKSRSGAPENKSLDSYTKAELIARAEKAGVELASSDTKADIISKLEDAGK